MRIRKRKNIPGSRRDISNLCPTVVVVVVVVVDDVPVVRDLENNIS